MDWRDVAIDRGDIGVRIDRVLLRHLAHEPGVSRARIQRWIAAGRVTVNGAPAPRVAWRVAAGDTICVDAREIRRRSRPRPEPIALDVLFEDADLLAVNKPAGVVVHPSYRHERGTIINALIWRAQRWSSGDAPALLTRLDKMTSGVLLVAKRRAVVAALQHEMRAERIEKDYLAVVIGRPPARGTIDLALDRDPWDRRRVTVTDRGGQPAVTRFERLGTTVCGPTDGDAPGPTSTISLLMCRLVTGRMHQIRAHLAHKGWPLVGDPVYGRRAGKTTRELEAVDTGLDRQALHAWRVALRHPVTGAALMVEAPLPSDLAALLGRLGLRLPSAEKT
jgi:23S rRNA pseudouridine1911/1915/1917 synthase